MRRAWAPVCGFALLLFALLVDAGLLDAGPAETGSSLVLGAVGALLLVWGVAHPVVLPQVAAPRLAARERRRAVARRAVPRQRDPDAAGHTRSRAPSDLLPAA